MFYRLILAHLVGDFVLQTRWMVARKRTLSGLSVHLAAVGLATAAVAWDRLQVWWPWLLALVAAHGLTDWAKVRLEPRLRLPPILLFLADQIVHVLLILAVVALANRGRLGPAVSQPDPSWWIASLYVLVTFALSIALPLWLDPPSVMRRPLAARLTLIVVAALAMTLAWRGLPLLIPVVGLSLYAGIGRRLARHPATATFGVEFWSAVALAASLGWGLA